jgi:hypothetical protein
MIVLVDTMAERYGMLPSEVMGRATTFDLFICDTAIGYRNYQNDKAAGRTPSAPQMSLDELMEFHKSGKSRSK